MSSSITNIDELMLGLLNTINTESDRDASNVHDDIVEMDSPTTNALIPSDPERDEDDEKAEDVLAAGHDVVEDHQVQEETLETPRNSLDFQKLLPEMTPETEATECSYKISKQIQNDCIDFNHCAASHRIKGALRIYDLMCGDSIFEDLMEAIFSDEYSVASLYDDFHHILDVHSINDDALQFESCHEFMVEADASNTEIFCDIDTCQTIKRYYKRRHLEDEEKEEALSDDIASDDYRACILWQIHCYLLHAQDTVKLSRNERVQMEEKLSIDTDGDDIEEKRWGLAMDRMKGKRQRFDKLMEGIVNEKFVRSTFSEHHNDEDLEYKESDDDEPEVDYAQMEDEELVHEFSRITGCSQRVSAALLSDCKWDFNAAKRTFQVIASKPSSFESYVPKGEEDANRAVIHTEGIQCWYWDPNQIPEGAVLVIQRHVNLKDEVLDLPPNGSRLSRKNWFDLYRQCQQLVKTQKVRRMRGNGSNENVYGIDKGTPISCKHLIAIKIYTDFTKLNQMFCEHFRLKKIMDDILESRRSLGIRNGKFWNLAKLLMEAVQCFGEFREPDAKYYRGLDKPFMFPSFVSRYHTPLSTSKSVCISSCCSRSCFQASIGDMLPFS